MLTRFLCKVNYLVWRYLQESGFGNAALQLSRCWIRDPDTLPFAHNVEPHTLIRLLQDGMCFDKLQAEACNTAPRYQFGADHGRPYSSRNGALLTLDKGIPAHELAAEANGAVQEPPPKKGVKRKKGKPTNGIESRPEPEVNGDAMDIEQNGTTHVTNSVRAESEAMGSDAESPTVVDIPISTLSIGQDAEIQTEVVEDLASRTVFIPRQKEIDSVVEHTSWGPAEAPVLLAAGNSLLQIHLVEKDTEQDKSPSVRTVDLSLPVNNFEITALCWHSHGEITVSVREQCFNEVGEKMMMEKLIRLSDGGQTSRVISSTAGLVSTLRWNVEKELLLSISSDGEKGSIKVWKSDSDSIPTWTEFTETAILDALWISDSAFVVCGIEIFKIYEISNSDLLTTQRTLDTAISWETIKYDESSGIIAALGIRDSKSYIGLLHPSDALNLQVHEYPDQYPTDLDFCTKPPANGQTNGTSIPPVVFATCSMTGPARIWDANEPFSCIKKLATTDESQAFKISFSPDGSLLAAAGPDAVTVWNVEKRDVPIASWRAKDFPDDQWNASIDGEFSLGWDPDSSRLSIALQNQVCACASFTRSF